MPESDPWGDVSTNSLKIATKYRKDSKITLETYEKQKNAIHIYMYNNNKTRKWKPEAIAIAHPQGNGPPKQL